MHPDIPTIPIPPPTPTTPTSPTTMERREVEHRLVPVYIQILFFLFVVVVLYVSAFTEDGSFTNLLDCLDDAGGRREAGGRPLNTRTAERVVDVRSPITLPHPATFPAPSRAKEPRSLSEGIASVCKQECHLRLPPHPQSVTGVCVCP